VFTETLESFDNGYYQSKKQALLKDLYLITEMNQSILRQKKILEREDSLQRVEYNANESLANEKVVAPLELNKEKGLLLNREQSLEQLTSTILNNVTLDLNKKKEILELQKSISDVKQSFQSGLMTLKSNLENWKTQYIVVAPEKGKVQFVSFMQVNQSVKSGQELLYVIPEQPSYFGEVAAPQRNFGKIKKQQHVIINLSSYPNNEFGSIRGIVDYIPSVPYRDSAFLIRVGLPNGLTTSHHTRLSFKNNLSGEAKIIIEERTAAKQFLLGFLNL
jgi:HlyD family secretion protein